MARFPRHEPGHAFTSPLDEVEPGVFSQGRVRIRLAGRR